jgi:hypothetical protein
MGGNTSAFAGRKLSAMLALMKWFKDYDICDICTTEGGDLGFKFKGMTLDVMKIPNSGEGCITELALSEACEYCKRAPCEAALIDFIDPHDYREMNETDATHVMFDMNVDNEFWKVAKGYTEQDLESLADMGVFPRVSVEVDKENLTAVVMFGDDEDSFDVLEITSSDRCLPFLEMAGAVKYPTP